MSGINYDKLQLLTQDIAEFMAPAVTAIQKSGKKVNAQNLSSALSGSGLLNERYKLEKSKRQYKKAVDSFGSDKLSELYDSILNRDGFSYDAQKDALYKQYKNQYTRLGKQAMEDTVGRSAALTGGYASTYAQSAGNKQYDSYLAKLYDRMPELYAKAYQRYEDEGDKLRGMYESEYSRLEDELGRKKEAYDLQLDSYEAALKEHEKKQTAAKEKKQAAQKAAEKAKKEQEAQKQAAAKQKQALEQQAAKQQAAAQSLARTNAMTLLKTGNMPDKKTLQTAGIPLSDAKQIASYYATLLNKRLYG